MPEVAGFFLDYHTRKGVKFVLGGKAAVIKGEGTVRAVGLTDGSEIPADIVIVGIGVDPDTSLAEKAVLAVGDGIVTDRFCRTSDPAIYAIGDCASRPLVHYGRTARLAAAPTGLDQQLVTNFDRLEMAPPRLRPVGGFQLADRDLRTAAGSLRARQPAQALGQFPS